MLPVRLELTTSGCDRSGDYETDATANCAIGAQTYSQESAAEL